MIYHQCSSFFDSTDLDANRLTGGNSEVASQRVPHVYRQDLVYTNGGFPPKDNVFEDYYVVCRRSQNANVVVQRTISCRGLDTTDVSRNPVRHRGLSFCVSNLALSHGESLASTTRHVCRYQLGVRLAYLCRVRTTPHRLDVPTLCYGRFRNQFVGYFLSIRLHNHQSAHATVSSGAISLHQDAQESRIF